MTRQHDEDRLWSTRRRRSGSTPVPHRRTLAPRFETLEARALLATLAAPANLAGMALSAVQVSLSWTESSSYRDFEVEWSSNGGKSYTNPVDSSTTTYVAAALTPSTSYLFRVRAVSSTSSSSWAGPVSVTTQAPATYFDNFSTDPLTPPTPWTFTTNEWSYGTDSVLGPILQQTQNGSPTTVDRKAMLTGLPDTPNPNDIIARVRIDTWMTGEYARAGVGLDTNPATGQGYDLVFTGRWSNVDPTHPVHLEFLDDGVAWSGWLVNGSQTTVAYSAAETPQPGQWYWFHMNVSNGILYGNVWPDVTPTLQNPPASGPGSEPAGWEIIYNPASQREQSEWNRTGGVAALTGSDAGTFPGEAPSGGSVSFDDVTVRSGVVATPTGTTTAGITASAVHESTLTHLAREIHHARRKR